MNIGFKQTEIGVLPEEWEVMPIGETLKIKHGKSQKEVESKNGLYPILGTGGLMGYANRFLYDKESILIGRKGTIDKPKYMNTPFWSVDTLFYSEVNDNYSAKYLYYNFLMIDWYRHNEASGVPSLNAKTIEKICIPIAPTLAEQTAIATALSDMDALITQTQRLIQKKKDIKQGLMQKLLMPKVGWEVKKLGEVGEVKMCRRVFNHETKPVGIIPFYKIGTFGQEADAYISKELYQNYRQRFSFPKKGDTLISAAGTIGRTLVYDGKPAYFQDSNIVWIDNNEILISNEFLYFVLQIVKYNTEGGTIQRLYNSILRNAEFYCPPKSEQTQIAQILTDADNEIQALETKRNKQHAQKQGMMQVLLTGKIRLK